jgi:hypothetical protein
MKKIVMAMLLVLGLVQAGLALTEEQRYRRYVVSAIEEVINGGALKGQIYESIPGQNWPQEPKMISFGDYFKNGRAQALMDCDVSWYQGWATWNNLSNVRLFRSQYMEQTYISAGLQTMPFIMKVESARLMKLNVQGALLNDGDELWFNGARVYQNEAGIWQVYAYKPWNLIGAEVEVVWTGRGGWRIQMDENSFSGVINLNTALMDQTLLAPTKLKAISFLAEGSELEEGLVRYTGRSYDADLGCTVLNLQSLFDKDMKEFTLVLRGLDEQSGQMVNYYTVCLQDVGDDFMVPLGDTYIRPWTEVKVYLMDPRTGDYMQKRLDAQDLWRDVPVNVVTPMK